MDFLACIFGWQSRQEKYYKISIVNQGKYYKINTHPHLLDKTMQ